jgi:hypothetical protein
MPDVALELFDREARRTGSSAAAASPEYVLTEEEAERLLTVLGVLFRPVPWLDFLENGTVGLPALTADEHKFFVEGIPQGSANQPADAPWLTLLEIGEERRLLVPQSRAIDYEVSVLVAAPVSPTRVHIRRFRMGSVPKILDGNPDPPSVGGGCVVAADKDDPQAPYRGMCDRPNCESECRLELEDDVQNGQTHLKGCHCPEH